MSLPPLKRARATSPGVVPQTNLLAPPITAATLSTLSKDATTHLLLELASSPSNASIIAAHVARQPPPPPMDFSSVLKTLDREIERAEEKNHKIYAMACDIDGEVSSASSEIYGKCVKSPRAVDREAGFDAICQIADSINGGPGDELGNELSALECQENLAQTLEQLARIMMKKKEPMEKVMKRLAELVKGYKGSDHLDFDRVHRKLQKELDK